MVGLAGCSSTRGVLVAAAEAAATERSAAGRPRAATGSPPAADRPGGRRARGDADDDGLALAQAGRDLGVGAVGQAGGHPHRDELAVLDREDDVAPTGAIGSADGALPTLAMGLLPPPGVRATLAGLGGRARRRPSGRPGAAFRGLAALGVLATLALPALTLPTGMVLASVTGLGGARLTACATLLALVVLAAAGARPSAADQALLEGGLRRGRTPGSGRRGHCPSRRSCPGR